MKCPQCNSTILNENINIQDNIAKCTFCSHIFKASEGLNDTDSKFQINQPPSGAWYEPQSNEVIFGATTRSATALYLIPFTCIWSGFSLSMLYGSQIANQQFSLHESLFGIPFLLGSILLIIQCLMSVFGKVEICANREGGTIFTGIGPIGSKKSFLWREISTINNGISKPWFQRDDQEAIVIEGTSSYTFGGDLNEQRRYYILNALKKMKVQSH